MMVILIRTLSTSVTETSETITYSNQQLERHIQQLSYLILLNSSNTNVCLHRNSTEKIQYKENKIINIVIVERSELIWYMILKLNTILVSFYTIAVHVYTMIYTDHILSGAWNLHTEVGGKNGKISWYIK